MSTWTAPTADCHETRDRGCRLQHQHHQILVWKICTVHHWQNVLLTDYVWISVRHLDHILLTVYSSMQHVTWKLPGPMCGWVGRILHPDSIIKWPFLRTRSSMVARHRTLVDSSAWPTYRVDELFAPPTLAASSSHSPTGPLLATEPFLLLVPRSGTVCMPPEVTSAPSLDTFRKKILDWLIDWS